MKLLSEFLEQFKEYCLKMYPGSLNQMASLLGQYLDGPLIQIFRVLKQPYADYQQLKPQLLSWYCEDRERSRAKLDEDFSNLHQQLGESVAIYAARALGLARRCLPGIDPKTISMVREKFLSGLQEPAQSEVKKTIRLQ